eukprot:CAMPEP_0180331954 /NCGR_PEP_ID=MMETSP0988-20121125/42255_1 /TAXON_ID=697907 /ORGANISM="non described non described, Strain CCMP2293" /LENGTH=30 /DNA_ID= /DNA_START= /DNA_END= /DNA_ORIENTATION=
MEVVSISISAGLMNLGRAWTSIFRETGGSR